MLSATTRATMNAATMRDDARRWAPRCWARRRATTLVGAAMRAAMSAATPVGSMNAMTLVGATMRDDAHDVVAPFAASIWFHLYVFLFLTHFLSRVLFFNLFKSLIHWFTIAKLKRDHIFNIDSFFGRK